MPRSKSKESIITQKTDSVLTPKESSVQFMLTEFTRIQAAELYNRSSGDSRVNLYITVLTFICAGIVALRQIIISDKQLSLQSYYFISFIALMFVSLVGILTFRMLLERWHLTVIYLRKLARIRRWFAAQDSSLKNNLAYTTDEKYPSFISKKFLSSSLITFISILNSFTIITMFVFLIAIFFPYVRLIILFPIGVIGIIIIWFIKRILALKLMSKLKEDKYGNILPDEKM